MIEPVLVPRSQISETNWNTLIERSGYSIPYATTWYLDCVSPHWQALVWPSSTDYQIVLPLPVRKKWGIRVIQQPLFCQFLGFFSCSEITSEAMSSFLNVLHRHFPYISSYAFHPGCLPLIQQVLIGEPTLSFKIQATHCLDIDNGGIANRINYSKDRLANWKKSQRWEWALNSSTDIKPLLTLFQENHEESIEGGVHTSAYQLLQRLFAEGFKRDVMKLLYASHQNTLHAGCLLLIYQTRTVYLFNAADSMGRKGNARTYLLDNYITSKESTSTFDFESPEVASIASFYESFGAKRQEYLVIKKNKLPFPFRQLQEWRKQWLTST